MRNFLPKDLNSRPTQVHASFVWRTLLPKPIGPRTMLFLLSLSWCIIEAKKLNHVFVQWVFWIIIYLCHVVQIFVKIWSFEIFPFLFNLSNRLQTGSASTSATHKNLQFSSNSAMLSAISTSESHIVSVSLIWDYVSSGSDWKSDSWRELSISESNNLRNSKSDK